MGVWVCAGAWEKTAASGCSVLTSPFTTFEHAFNNIWANNADAISLLYSGTGALKTDFTRTGKRTLAGAIADGVNSLKRYVLNNLVDGRTQDAWDLFTGRFVPHRAHLHTAASSGSLSSVKHHHRVHTDGSTTISVHLANHHAHHHHGSASGKLTPGASPAVNPLQEHKQGPTPVSWRRAFFACSCGLRTRWAPRLASPTAIHASRSPSSPAACSPASLCKRSSSSRH